MKTKKIGVKLSEARFGKLKASAAARDKTMTQLIEELIDSLPAVGG